jgi:hypothetical protein
MSVQISHDDVIGDVAGCGREVSVLPEALAPLAFADVFELLLDFARRTPLCPTHEVADRDMRRNLDEHAHAAVLMDQTGWHTTGKLGVPDNINIIALPPKCPELNPVENIWQFIRDNWLSNHVFTSHDPILDHCCEA